MRTGQFKLEAKVLLLQPERGQGCLHDARRLGREGEDTGMHPRRPDHEDRPVRARSQVLAPAARAGAKGAVTTPGALGEKANILVCTLVVRTMRADPFELEAKALLLQPEREPRVPPRRQAPWTRRRKILGWPPRRPDYEDRPIRARSQGLAPTARAGAKGAVTTPGALDEEAEDPGLHPRRPDYEDIPIRARSQGLAPAARAGAK